MSAFRIFAPEPNLAPTDRSGGNEQLRTGLVRPRRTPLHVGGSLNREGNPAEESEPTDLMSPMGSLRNYLRIAVQKGARDPWEVRACIIEQAKRMGEREKEAETIAQAILDVHLPALQESLVYWTATPEVADKVTLEQVLDSMQKIERGDKTLRAFLFQFCKEYADFSNLPGNTPAKFASSIMHSEEARAQVIPLWNKLQSFDATAAPSKDFYETLTEFIDTLKKTVKSSKLSVQFSLEDNTNDPAVFSKVLELRNRAEREGKSLQVIIEQLLSDIQIEDPDSGKPIKARQLILNNVPDDAGENLFVKLPGTELITRMQSAQRHFDQMVEPGKFVIDRSNSRRGTEDVRRVYNSLGAPISRALYLLHSRDQADENENLEVVKLETLSRDLQDEFFHALRVALAVSGQKVPPIQIAEAAKRLTKGAEDKEALKRAYQQAKDRMNEKETEGTNWVPDDFARLQKYFTEALFEEIGVNQELDKLNNSEHIELVFAGVHRDPEVDGLLRSEQLDDADVAAKRNRMEVFINSLRNYFNITEAMAPRTTPKERAELSIIAKAIYSYATELRSKRLDAFSSNTKETATLFRNYGEAFRILVNKGLLEPLPGQLSPPPRYEGESDEEYMLASRDGRYPKIKTPFLSLFMIPHVAL